MWLLEHIAFDYIKPILSKILGPMYVCNMNELTIFHV